MDSYELSEREKAILRYVIHQFILTANPVGSRNISKKYQLGLSPATIRNIMADLEESGFLRHPHTSAGRLPTDQGYRVYVDSLMDPPLLDLHQRQLIDSGFEVDAGDTDGLLKITASILSDLTKQLACVTYPKFETAMLQKIQLVRLSSSRLMVVVSIKSGLVKTITLEVNADIEDKKLNSVQHFLNERLSGLQLVEIRKTFKERIQDYYTPEYRPIIRIFLDSVDKIFADSDNVDKTFIHGAKNILSQPEFEHPENFQGIIELIEDKNIVIHIMDKHKAKDNGVAIAIGKETKNSKFTEYSLISKEYSIGGAKGMLGIIGPKRMEYSKVVATVVYLAEQLSKELKKID